MVNQPFIGAIVREIVLLKRALNCNHKFSIVINDKEKQCDQCSIISTEDGMNYLEANSKVNWRKV